MYIPTTFMSSQGSCFNVTTSKLSGSGSISSGSFISGGFVWDYYSFNNTADPKQFTQSFSASFNILSGSSGQAKILIVGAGGGGGYNPGDACINPYIDTLGSAGGGGGGGVVYYNQFPLSSGSYEVVVGTAGVGGQDLPTLSRIGSTGSVSYFKNKEFTYTPFTSSLITAYGGGGGAANAGNCGGTSYGHGTFGATYGGSSQTAIAAVDVPETPNPSYIGGNPAVIQGYGVGSIAASPNGNDRVTGGGGAGGRAANVPGPGQNSAGSPGGDGIQYNVTGTPTYYGAGGGGVRFANTGLGTLSGNGTGWGNPGSGGTGGFGGRFGNVRGAEPGTNGVVIIAIPRCATNLNICTEYRILGGATGGTITYIPCGTSTLASASINTGYTGSVCTLKIGSFPSSTGTVTLTQTGSCNSFIPLAATQSCASGTIQTPAYVYDWEVPIACYPTPSNCQKYRTATSTINYVDYLGVSQSVTVGGGFGSNTGQICARELPTPTILCDTLTGGFGNCAITKTSLVCGYYCSGSV